MASSSSSILMQSILPQNNRSIPSELVALNGDGQRIPYFNPFAALQISSSPFANPFF